MHFKTVRLQIYSLALFQQKMRFPQNTEAFVLPVHIFIKNNLRRGNFLFQKTLF